MDRHPACLHHSRETIQLRMRTAMATAMSMGMVVGMATGMGICRMEALVAPMGVILLDRMAVASMARALIRSKR